MHFYLPVFAGAKTAPFRAMTGLNLPLSPRLDVPSEPSLLDDSRQGGQRMRRGKQLIGLPVVELATGRRVSLVRSLLFDPDGGHLAALVLQKSNLLAEVKAVRVNQLHAIGADAVLLLPGEEPETLASILADLPRAVTEDKIAGRPVLTADGRMLGTLADLTIAEDSGRITQFVLSDGLIQDLIGGYSTMPAPEQAVYGDEHIIVPESGDWSG